MPKIMSNDEMHAVAQEELEAAVEAIGLGKVLDLLREVCYDKAEVTTAKDLVDTWNEAGIRLGGMSIEFAGLGKLKTKKRGAQ